MTNRREWICQLQVRRTAQPNPRGKVVEGCEWWKREEKRRRSSAWREVGEEELVTEANKHWKHR
jgi:hypothetical protein